MFGRRFDLFRVFGIAIRVDLSWFVVLALITWSLATGWFPQTLPGMATAGYWWMGFVGALGLFSSVLLHELSHALVARRLGLQMRGITLFIFGGVAEMSDEPDRPRVEFLVAVAGPIASVVIGTCCWAATHLAVPSPVAAILQYLFFINFVLVAFNLVPAFPLDGGRVLRSALWQWKQSLRWATRVTSTIGSLFGMGLIALGIYLFFRTGFSLGALWWILIGFFLRNAAQMSYQQMLLRRTLEGEPVRRFMQPDPVTVSRSLSVRELVESYIYRYHHKLFPVVDGDRLVGCVTTQQVRELAPEEWDRQSVGALAQGCSTENTITPDEDAMHALAKMNRTGSSRLMVVDGGRLVGILALKDLLKFFSLKVELEQSTR